MTAVLMTGATHPAGRYQPGITQTCAVLLMVCSVWQQQGA